MEHNGIKWYWLGLPRAIKGFLFRAFVSVVSVLEESHIFPASILQRRIICLLYDHQNSPKGQDNERRYFFRASWWHLYLRVVPLKHQVRTGFDFSVSTLAGKDNTLKTYALFRWNRCIMRWHKNEETNWLVQWLKWIFRGQKKNSFCFVRFLSSFASFCLCNRNFQ